MRIFIVAALSAVSLSLAGCSNDPPLATAAQLTQLAEAAGTSENAETYRLGAGDKLRVVVFNEEQLTGEVTVDPTGSISLPLVGSVRARGQTAEQLARAVADRLRGTYLRDPNVSIQVVQTRPFYVIGEVSKPGEYPFRPGLTVQAAVAIAGGFTFRAQTRRVYISRENGGPEVGVDSSTFVLAPGDVLRIGERMF